jgi:hypothetical protein
MYNNQQQLIFEICYYDSESFNLTRIYLVDLTDNTETSIVSDVFCWNIGVAFDC